MLKELWLAIAGAIVIGVLTYLLPVIGQLVAVIPGIEPRSIRGRWHTTFLRQSDRYDEYATVNQFLHWVWGTITYPGKDRTYKFRGTIRAGVVVAHYELMRNPAVLDRGAFTIKLNNQGDAMKGKYCWTDDTTSDVCADDYQWSRTTLGASELRVV